MAKSSQEVVCEGWLTKSPPSKRIFRARWRKRYFSLTNTGELPGQYILTYYTDRHCRKLKGTINLDTCEQVDLGLKFEERKLKFDHVFDIKTPTRTYYLAAETEEEMQSWVDNICKVCGLKSSDPDQISRALANDVEIEEIPENKLTNYVKSPPISPASTSPYIPISECITQKSPVLNSKDFNTLLEYNMKNSYFQTDHNNETYEHPPQKPSQIYLNEIDPRFYDSPRQLLPPPSGNNLDTSKHEYKNSSPMLSPTDSESVFTDEDWGHNISEISMRLSQSSDVDISSTHQFIKGSKITSAPPRPPKPAHIAPAPSYLNLTPLRSNKENEENETKYNIEKAISDDMYDFPRSHNVDSDTLKSARRHCYNNAAPVNVEGNIFRYDISPKPSTSTTVFRYDDDSQEEPASPHSHTSSTPAYSNLPSPSDTQTLPPPMVNRGLKPKRKLSDSHSICSNPEPPSPRSAPSVDRKLKPPTPHQEAHMRKVFHVEDDCNRKIRAAPSPTPPTLGRSHESLLSKYDDLLSNKIQYLDLDLDAGNSNSGNTKIKPVKEAESDTVYKKVDFAKTEAFNITRNNLEKERQEPVVFKK